MFVSVALKDAAFSCPELIFVFMKACAPFHPPSSGTDRRISDMACPTGFAPVPEILSCWSLLGSYPAVAPRAAAIF